MAVISNLIARLRADTAAFDRNMNRSRRQMSSFTTGVKTMGRQMLLMGAAGGGIYAIQRGFKAIIKAASDAQETQAKFNTVFGKLSVQANRWAESFGDSIGRSEESVKSWMARLQDTFVPLGIARDEALKLAKSLTTLAVDVASFNNAADADVIRDFTSTIVGQHETVRKYGIIISESAMRQEAFRQGIRKTYKELTDLEKIQLRVSLIIKGSTDAQGDALRTTDSYANTVKRLSAEWEDLNKTMGNMGPLSLATELFRGFTLLIEDTTEATKKLKKSLEELPKTPKSLFPLLSPTLKIETYGPFESAVWARNRERLMNLPPPRLSGEDLIREKVIKRGREEMAQMQKMIELRVEQQEMMEAHYEKIKAEEGSYQAMQERMARQRIETEIAVVTQQMQIEIGAREKAAQASLEIARAAAERHKRIAEDIAFSMASSWSNAMDKMMFEGKEFWDAMKDMARSLTRQIANIIIYKKLAEPLAYRIMGLPLPGSGGGGLSGDFPTTSHGVPYMPGLQHGGKVLKTGLAVVHRNETFSGVQGGGERKTRIEIHNEGSENLEISRAEEYFLSDQRIIEVFIRKAQTDGQLRRSIKQASR